MADSRKQQAQVSTHMHREANNVLAIVQAEPACSLGDARAKAGLGRRVFAAALENLVEAGLVHRVVVHPETILLPDRPGLTECTDQIRILCQPCNRQLHRFLHDQRFCQPADVVRHASEAWGWTPERTEWRLRQLEKADLVQVVVNLQDMRSVTYRSLPAHPVVSEIFGSAKPEP